MASRNPSSAVPGTPSAKRQKTASGYWPTNLGQNAGGYSSDNDSGDELFANFIPDTPGNYQTQPTQILDRTTAPASSSPETPKNVVQVPASSPLASTTLINSNPTTSDRNAIGSPQGSRLAGMLPQQQANRANGILNGHKQKQLNDVSVFPASNTYKPPLAMSMAPAGTSYRPPIGITSKPSLKTEYINLSDDDGPTFQGGSSDDEIEEVANIKPTNFISKSAQNSFGSLTVNGTSNASRFPDVRGYAYTGLPQSKTPGASVSSGQNRIPPTNISTFNPDTPLFGPSFSTSSAMPPVRNNTQRKPERAQPIQDIAIRNEANLRENIIRLQAVLPYITDMTAKDALILSRGSLDDAVALLADSPRVSSKSANVVNLVSDGEDVDELSQPAKRQEPQMKRTLNGPAQSIRDKYSSTQAGPPKQPLSVTPQPRKRKLVQGRKNPSSPAALDFLSPPKPINADSPAADSYDSDSGVGSAEEEDPLLECRVLKYLNTCEVADLVELTNITKDIAEVMLKARPFKSLDAARTVENTKPLKSGKKSNRAPIGDKIVDTAMEMFQGYEAIDTLVTKCGELSKPLTAEMTRWGFDVFGAAKDGELEMTSLDDDPSSQRDSGIGSPNSATISNNEDDEVKVTSRRRAPNIQFLKKPNLMAPDCVLKDYQIVGLNWLALMSRHGLSGILADEMGLGKTCQVIAFLTHLVENGKTGPHLVVCPGSTLENWLREFQKFSPHIVFEPYHGPQKERAEMAEDILARRSEINVVVTTYDMAAKNGDNKFLRKLKPDVCVYDEGHMLKNVKSQRYQGLIRIPARFRLLLTGTPLQNNLQELAALLAFILPDVFRDLEEDLNTIFKAKATTSDADHAALLSAQRIARARSMLTPFVLRRKKAQVLKHLPAKTCRVEFCALHKTQKDIYDGHLDQARERARIRVEGGKIPKTENNENNPLMQLRKASIHPLLFRRHFTNAKIEKMADILRKKAREYFPDTAKREHLIEEMRSGSDFWLHQWCLDYPCISSFDIPDLQWMDSGKVESMMKLVKSYKENGDRVLIFSQFSLVLDILEAVLNSSLVSFTRIDGSTKIDERQSLIDTFRDDESITVFLLTTKAGGTGINLMYANKVIIFDGSFNPQDDRQAENRAHRVGQVREVEVVRLVTRGTVEEQIYALGQSKLELDGRVAGDEDSGKAEEAGEKAISKMLLEGTGMISEETPEVKEVKEEVKDKAADIKAVPVEPEKKMSQKKKSSILDMLTKKEILSKKKSLGGETNMVKGGQDEEKKINVDKDGEAMLV